MEMWQGWKIFVDVSSILTLLKCASIICDLLLISLARITLVLGLKYKGLRVP